ncbi:hypothetical protein Q3G72_010325 [Acer saccharum]|nr:hypothetical protein Q3G72_010325 [Acer saccharum]
MSVCAYGYGMTSCIRTYDPQVGSTFLTRTRRDETTRISFDFALAVRDSDTLEITYFTTTPILAPKKI